MAKYAVATVEEHTFWLDNETYADPYDEFVLVDDSNYDRHYGAATVIVFPSRTVVFMARLVFEWMCSGGRTDEEIAAAEEFLAPVAHMYRRGEQN